MPNEDKERLRAFMEADFFPNISPFKIAPTAENRIAIALEYIAHRSGKIDQ